MLLSDTTASLLVGTNGKARRMFCFLSSRVVLIMPHRLHLQPKYGTKSRMCWFLQKPTNTIPRLRLKISGEPKTFSWSRLNVHVRALARVKRQVIHSNQSRDKRLSQCHHYNFSKISLFILRKSKVCLYIGPVVKRLSLSHCRVPCHKACSHSTVAGGMEPCDK